MWFRYRRIAKQCRTAVESVRDNLSEVRLCELEDCIAEHGEYLLALEFAIDWLCEEDAKISIHAYHEFQQAYAMMACKSDKRLQDLKSLVV